MGQVEEKRTPLQIAMDDLAKRLSIFSFGVIGVIIIIGVWQKRGWLEMFTIGGELISAVFDGRQYCELTAQCRSLLLLYRRDCLSLRPSRSL